MYLYISLTSLTSSQFTVHFKYSMTYLYMMASQMHLLMEVLVVDEMPPLGWLLHEIPYFHFLVLLPWGFFCSRHFYKLTNSNNNHEHHEMMLCNDFPH